MSRYVYTFRSYDELVNRAIHGPSTCKNRQSRGAHDSWSGGSWQTAETLAPTGDVDTARKMAPTVIDGANRLIGSAARFDPEYRLDGGASIDVARFVNGEPECWLEMVESDPVPRKALDVMLAIGASCKVPQEALTRAAMEAGAAVLGLQALGFMVTLWVSTTSDSHRPSRGAHQSLFGAPVNPHGRALDIAKLAAVCQSWFFRRIMFSLWETCFDDKQQRLFGVAHGNYGYSRNAGIIDAQELTGKKDVVILNIKELIGRTGEVSKMIERAALQCAA